MGSIVVENLGKSYKGYRGRWGRLASWFGLNGGVTGEHWVLRGINFKLSPGEAVGIIGQNGAGKSTLLKLLTGTVRPTEGSVHMVGRVSALLELGMGFHQDLTGRQNAYLSGSLLGFSQVEVADLMPEIEAFAEIGEYIDQPMRVYSSGMQARLAFSVATAIRPDILIVDEVLSVGDAYFQLKSFERIRKFRQQGTTLLIVSHDKAAIQSICDSAILLGNGGIAKQGEPEVVMDYYNALLVNKESVLVRQERLTNGRMQTNSGLGEVTITDIDLYNSQQQKVEIVYVGESVTLHIKAKVNKSVPSLILGCGIKDRLGQMMFGTNTFHTQQTLLMPELDATYLFKVAFDANLGEGSYSVNVALVKDLSVGANYEWRENILVFQVINKDKYIFVGTQWNEMKFNIEKLLF